MKQSKFLLSLFVIFMTVVAFNPAMAQSRKDKKKTQQAEWEYEQRMKELQRQKDLDELELSNTEVDMAIPCLEESHSDKEYYRKLGEAKLSNIQMARMQACTQARKMLYIELALEIEGLITDYTNNVLQTEDTAITTLMGNELSKTVGSLYTEIVCEKNTIDSHGDYHCYVVVQIKKDDFANVMADAISKNEKLSNIISTNQFREYAKDYIGQNRTQKNNQ